MRRPAGAPSPGAAQGTNEDGADPPTTPNHDSHRGAHRPQTQSMTYPRGGLDRGLGPEAFGGNRLKPQTQVFRRRDTSVQDTRGSSWCRQSELRPCLGGRSIPAGCVAPRLHRSTMRPRRALSTGRLDHRNMTALLTGGTSPGSRKGSRAILSRTAYCRRKSTRLSRTLSLWLGSRDLGSTLDLHAQRRTLEQRLGQGLPLDLALRRDVGPAGLELQPGPLLASAKQRGGQGKGRCGGLDEQILHHAPDDPPAAKIRIGVDDHQPDASDEQATKMAVLLR
jgi:hypothetical protein